MHRRKLHRGNTLRRSYEGVDRKNVTLRGVLWFVFAVAVGQYVFDTFLKLLDVAL